MDSSSKQNHGRRYNQVRPISIQYDALGYADASVLFQIGQTKVLASVTLQDGVPHFLRGQRTGWLTAEYSMLPCATQKRTNRESTQHYRNSRSVEISRLIGRSLRTIVDVSGIGERTIIIDCDVLQADGGTRVASITAASLALDLASKRWLNAGIVEESVVQESVAAVSVGVVDDDHILDLSFEQDSQAEADFNFVLTESGKLIEVQGTAEQTPLSWQDFESLKKLAVEGVEQIFKACANFYKDLDLTLRKRGLDKKWSGGRTNTNQVTTKTKKVQLFSLGNRLNKTL